ncbi:uncharacterized protein [Amphiura filiformis]|uniref:uncharacterized protein n=1 Tax=Amphiura filiformis TaxID=82378 RepID=UPI003B216849
MTVENVSLRSEAGTPCREHLEDAENSANQAHSSTEEDMNQGTQITLGHEKISINSTLLSGEGHHSPTDSLLTTSITDKEKPTVSVVRGYDIDCSQNRRDSKVASGQSQYICVHCKQSFSDSDSLIHHNTKMHTQVKLGSSTTSTISKKIVYRGRYKCDECGEHYCQTYNELMIHKRKHGYNMPFKCQLCKNGFKNESSLKSHDCLPRIHGNEGTSKDPPLYVCSHCGNSYIDQSSLMKHKRRIHGITPPCKCQLCGKEFKNESLLNSHNCLPNIHSNEGNSTDPPLYVCSHCRNSYICQSSLVKHKRQIHGITPPCKCQLCGKEFKNESLLNGHNCLPRIHGNEGNSTDPSLYVNCSHCGNSYICQSSLVKHKRRIHGITTPCKCQLCGKEFKNESLLNSHNCLPRIHGNEGNSTDPSLYVNCSHCGNSYICQSSLVKHKRQIHGITPPCKCQLYGKEFKNESLLNGHNCLPRIHGNEGNSTDPSLYVNCSHCGNSYICQSSLVKHKRQTHGITPPCKCQLCGKEFKNESLLNSHNCLPNIHSNEGNSTDPSLYVNCSHCRNSYICQSSLVKHKRQTHGITTPCKCQLCGKEFKHKSSLRRHNCNKDLSAKLYACSHCGKQYKCKKWLESHNCSKLHVCSHCGNSYKKQSTLSIHEHRKHTTMLQERFPCTQCDKFYEWKSVLRTHMVAAHSVNGQLRPYLCSVCGKQFKHLTGFKQHEISAHSVIKPYQCPTCLKYFGSKVILRRHIAGKHRGEKPCLCMLCGKQFASNQSLEFHLRIHSKEKPYKCKFCNKSFRYISSLKNHERLHTGEKPYRCTECGSQFRTATLLYIHKKTKHTKDNPNVCSFCHTVWATKSHLNCHMRIHTKPCMCVICGRGFATKTSLKEHKLSHDEFVSMDETKDKLHICNICNKRFIRKSVLNQHMICHTKRYVCNICNQGFTRKDYLDMHMLCHTKGKPKDNQKTHKLMTEEQVAETIEQLIKQVQNEEQEDITETGKHTSHTGQENPTDTQLENIEIVKHGICATTESQDQEREKPYKCKFCNKSIGYLYFLKDHERLHTGEKPYRCTECGQQFRTANLLYIHKKTKHTKDNPNVCSFCHTVWATKGHLNCHMRIHTKPCKCVICGKGFATKSSLKEHKLKHDEFVSMDETKDMLHVCNICNKRFIYKSILKRHVICHTKLKPYVCNICNQGFASKRYMNRHISTCHTKSKPKDNQKTHKLREVMIEEQVAETIEQLIKQAENEEQEDITEAGKCTSHTGGTQHK